jgi:hypothetical protein
MLSGDDLTIVLFFIGSAISIGVAAVSAAGWRHPVLIGALFSLAGACLVIGAAWPALKTISPPVTATVDQVATNPVAWFVILILGMTASLLFPKRGGRTSRSLEQRGPLQHVPTVEAVREPPKAPIVQSPPPPVIQFPPGPPADATTDRIFVSESITPEYLIDFFKEHTAVQAAKLTEVYIGKWMKVTGSVQEVTLSTSDLPLNFHPVAMPRRLIRLSARGEQPAGARSPHVAERDGRLR